MKKVLLSVVAVALLAPTTIAQTRLVEKVNAEKGKINIPYSRYKLQNGLNVIIHEDRSDPIVHVDVTYHVGSAREEIGKSGFAHFFEHMMFQGSDNVADEQHFKIITESGGTLNGTTNRDRTNYFETVPSNQLEKMLWLEADRMGFLLDAVTQQKFEVQRATVKNERGQNYDNRPYGLASEVAAKNLYPYGHPYSWLTIGYVEDLNRVNVNDLKNFFLRWYGPNNATLTIGGDVKAEEVLPLVEKYFGTIPPGPEVMPTTVPAAVLDKNRYVSYMDNYAKLPMLRIVYPTVPAYHEDEAPLDCLAEILGQGKNSIMYQKFIKAQKAVNATAMHPASELAGEFTITIIPYPGQKLIDMESMWQQALAEFEAKGVSDNDVEKFKTQHEASVINGLESVNGKVSTLASFMTFRGNPNVLQDELYRYNKVTKEDVMRVYRQYIKDKGAVVLSVLTKGNEENRAAPDNYTVSENGYNAPDYGYKHLHYKKAKDEFDRTKMPSSGKNPVVKVPEFWKKTLDDNIKVIGTQSTEIPVTTMLINIRGGELNDPKDKAGLASMFAAMMNEDTKIHSAEEFEMELDKLGSNISISSGLDDITIQVRSLTKNIDKTLALLEERLTQPDFQQENFNRIQKQRIESYKNSLNQPSFIASRVYDRVLYGHDNILGSLTTDLTYNNITLDDIKAYYDQSFFKTGAEVVIVSDLAQSKSEQFLSVLNKMKSGKVEVKKPVIPTPAAKTTIYFVDVPNAAQTEFRIGTTTPLRYDALGEYYLSSIMNYPLGGAFNSRLNLELREDKGWTYGARSGFSADDYQGAYTFSSGIKSNATDSAVRVVLKHLNDYKTNGIKADELSFTKNSMGQSEARKYESSYQKAGFLYRILKYDLKSTFPQEQNKLLNAMNLSAVNALAKKHLPGTDRLNIILVGDKASNWDKISQLGYPVVELNKEGKPKQ